MARTMLLGIKQRPQYALFVTLRVWGTMRRPRGCRGHHPSHREHQEHSRFAIQHVWCRLSIIIEAETQIRNVSAW